MAADLTASQRKRIERYSRAGLEQWQHERRDLIRELIAQGFTIRAIGELLDLAHARVHQIAREDDAA